MSTWLERARRELPDLRRDSEFWRRALRAGASAGPTSFVRYSPPFFGVLCAVLMPGIRKNVEKELLRLGAPLSPTGVYSLFANYASALTEAFAAASGRNDKLAGTIVGDEHYQVARALGRGVIVATAHTSGWYAAGPLLGSVYTDEVLLVMRRERDESAERIQAEARARLGLRVVLLGDDPLAAMPLLAHLRKGGIVALQIDRVPDGQQGVRVNVASEGEPEIKMELPEGPLLLSALSGAPIVVVLGKRVGFLEYRVQVSEPVRVPRRPNPIELSEAARAIAKHIATFVRENPEDWFHFTAKPE